MMSSIRIAFAGSSHDRVISCEACHSSEGGKVQKELAWTDPEKGITGPVAAPDEACRNCHTDQDIAAPAVEGTQAHPDSGCIDCHNPHKIEASCTQSTCHSSIRDIRSAVVEKPAGHPSDGDPTNYMCGGSACHELAKLAQGAPVYHQPIHSQVPCAVCHDASGMAVVKDEAQGWGTVPAAGGSEEAPDLVISHSIGREVVCQKCHSVNNPWNLEVILPEK